MVSLKKLIFGTLATAIGTGLIGYSLGRTDPVAQEILRLGRDEFSHINPLLDYQLADETLTNRGLRVMEESVESLIAQAIATNEVIEASFYYRDLDNGPWLSVHDDVYFTPASLLKVPIMITYFKYAETNPDILTSEILYAENDESVNSYVFSESNEEIQPGTTYTVLALIERMIIYSDNAAAILLQRNIDYPSQKKVYEDFDIPLPNAGSPRKPFLTARTYSGFFRILYNATYLDRAYSEMALKILSRSAFTSGIRAGLPKQTVVSNKFGIFGNTDKPGELLQLHDCGIIYGAKDYIICVMTTGTNLEVQAHLINEISKVVFIKNSEILNKI